MKSPRRLVAVLLLFSALLAPFLSAAPARIKIKLAPMPGIGHLVPELARGLGYFEQEGIEVEYVNVMNYRDEDFYSTELFKDGTIDAEICWYQRVVFGIGNDAPARAVLLIENSPHLTISVANRLKDQIKTAADFKGRTIADSEGFSTKRYLTDTVIAHAGLTPADYTPAPGELTAKLPLLVKALQANQVDIVSSMEPLTTGLMATKLVTPLFDLATGEGTRRALGDVWPARCLYLAPDYIKAHPDRVQRLVNVFVRTLRYIDTHSAEEIIAKLPAGYFAPDMNNDLWAEYKKGKIDEIAKIKPGMAHGDYSIPPSAAKLACEVLFHTNFDDSPEGKYRRAAAQSGKVRPEDTYDNRFVEKAMKEIK
ncbi:ABC transporter substrate-binding protein [Opitutus sp. GAS368]|uniref:ABC transporter substrate-binding protein n=1 Tax=Opitutus sp. GAS368 TaxID=1882749 RepID=UPI0012FDA150|nr:ABC transporter substrate-binding protein [Opitutus sp. GAS368]